MRAGKLAGRPHIDDRRPLARAQAAVQFCDGNVAGGRLAPRALDALAAVARLDDSVAFEPEQLAVVLPQFRVVVDEQDAFHRRHPAEPGAALPPARCDASLIYQAFTNLTSNALKFTPPGGRVIIRAQAAGSRVRVELHDTGPGVPEAERAQLFREHARISVRPTGGEESNGLGLSIVKHLVESQSGAVGAEFPATGGSVLWFELPAR